jgi:hypothetical protein
VTAITVEYSLLSDPGAGTQQQSRDAYWDVGKRCLLLREGVDPESLRDAAAKSIAAEFFGEAASAEMQAEFFRLLTVSLERARKLMAERSNWRLTPEQQEWLRQQNWQISVTELDEVEQPLPPRVPARPTPPDTTATPPIAAVAQPSSASTSKVAAQGAGSAANQSALTASGQSKQQSLRSDTETKDQEQEPQAQSASDASVELHDPNTTTADFVPVRAHTRSRPQRSRRRQTQEQENRRETPSSLTGASAEDKAALEKRGRDYAAIKLDGLGYKVTPMSQGNPGFDLKGERPGDTIEVEVKAHAGESSSVFITQREWEENLRIRGVSGVAWELWNVENLVKALGKKPTIQRIRHIPKSAMKESGYWIDLSQCSQEPPK